MLSIQLNSQHFGLLTFVSKLRTFSNKALQESPFKKFSYYLYLVVENLLFVQARYSTQLALIKNG